MCVQPSGQDKIRALQTVLLLIISEQHARAIGGPSATQEWLCSLTLNRISHPLPCPTQRFPTQPVRPVHWALTAIPNDVASFSTQAFGSSGLLRSTVLCTPLTVIAEKSPDTTKASLARPRCTSFLRRPPADGTENHTLAARRTGNTWKQGPA